MCYRFSVIHCYLRHWWQRRYCFDRRLSVCLCVCLSEKNRITQSYGWIFLKFGKTVDFLIRVLRYVSGQTDGQTHGHAGCNTFHTYRGDVITSRCAMRSCVRGVAPAQCRPETSVASSEWTCEHFVSDRIITGATCLRHAGILWRWHCPNSTSQQRLIHVNLAIDSSLLRATRRRSFVVTFTMSIRAKFSLRHFRHNSVEFAFG